MACPKKNLCPLFPLFATDGLLKIWQIRYCDSEKKYPTCERFKRNSRGEPMPKTMLPDGADLPYDPELND